MTPEPGHPAVQLLAIVAEEAERDWTSLHQLLDDHYAAALHTAADAAGYRAELRTVDDETQLRLVRVAGWDPEPGGWDDQPPQGPLVQPLP